MADLKYSEETFRDMYEALNSWGDLWDMQPLDTGADIHEILVRCWKKTVKALTKAEGGK